MQLQEKTDDDGPALKVSSQISKIGHVNPGPTHTKVPRLVFTNVRKVLEIFWQHALIRKPQNSSYYRSKIEKALVGALRVTHGQCLCVEHTDKASLAVFVLCLPCQSRKDSSSSIFCFHIFF